MPFNCLFIGGPKDGEWLCTPKKQRYFEAYRLLKQQPLIENSFDQELVAYETILYRSREFTGEKRIFVVFAPDAMDDDEIMDRLVSNYKPEAKDAS